MKNVPPSIRIVALCLLRRGAQFLVSVESDAVKGDAFCRFLGGGIEFGERSHEAVVREMQEELGVELANVRPFATLENLFVYNGQTGHEVVFVFEADFADRSLYEQESLTAYEAEVDAAFTAQWLSLREMDAQGIRFVPEALRSLVE